MSVDTRLRNEFWSGKTPEALGVLLVGKPPDKWDGDTDVTMPHIFPEWMRPELPGRTACLEIGAGVGRLLKRMAAHFTYAHGVDISQDMKDYSVGYLRETPNAHVYLTDGNSLPLLNQTYDYVYSYICFQHLLNYEEVNLYLREACRVLLPGGVIRVQTHRGEPAEKFSGYCGAYYRSLGDFEREFVHTGFTILKTEEGYPDPNTLWVTAQKPEETAKCPKFL